MRYFNSSPSGILDTVNYSIHICKKTFSDLKEVGGCIFLGGRSERRAKHISSHKSYERRKRVGDEKMYCNWHNIHDHQP